MSSDSWKPPASEPTADKSPPNKKRKVTPTGYLIISFRYIIDFRYNLSILSLIIKAFISNAKKYDNFTLYEVLFVFVLNSRFILL